MNDELIDVEEAARVLALSPHTVRAMVRDRKLVPVHPAGARRVRFLRSYIEVLAGLRSPSADVKRPAPVEAVRP